MRTRSRATKAIDHTACRDVNRRRPHCAKRLISLSSRTSGTGRGTLSDISGSLEAEVDERRDTLARNRRPRHHYREREADGEQCGAQPLDPVLEPLERALRQKLEPDHQTHREEHGKGPERWGPPNRQPAHVVPERPDGLRAEEDPAEADEVEDDEAPQPGGRAAPDSAVEAMLGDKPRALEGAPEDECPSRAVPQPAEHH